MTTETSYENTELAETFKEVTKGKEKTSKVEAS
jgi:hypothetical protein